MCIRDSIKKLKSSGEIISFDEAKIKQAVILPILSMLGWNVFNINEVIPEYTVSGRKVDYALRIGNDNKVFIEVKKGGEDLEKHQEQLLDYSFKEGIELAILTNGITWWYYLPLKKGRWDQRKFYTIDIVQQGVEEVVEKFIEFLLKESVSTGQAVRKAEEVYESRKKHIAIKDTLPKAWNKLIVEPNKILIELLSETTEKMCGYKPDEKEIRKFLEKYRKFIDFHEEKEKIKPKPSIKPKPVFVERESVSEDRIEKAIVRVLGDLGGQASRAEVLKGVLNMIEEFKTPYYQEREPRGNIRWIHRIDTVKAKTLKPRGYVKELKRGLWYLTEKGWEYYEHIKENRKL